MADVSGEVLFPWWLWILAILWTSAIVVHRQLATASEWKQPLAVLISVYTALLAFVSLRSVQAFTPADAAGVWVPILFTTSTLLAIGGTVATLMAPTRWQRGWHCLSMVGIAGIAALLQAYELVLLALVVGQLSQLNHEDDSLTENQATGHDASVREPVANGWLIIIAASLLCVIGIGLVQYGFRRERLQVIASRWYTALPERTAAAKWRATVGQTVTEFPLASLGVIVALLWLQVCRQRSFPDQEQSAPTVLITNPATATEPE